MKINSKTNPRHFGHLPLIALLGELEKSVENLPRQSQNKNIVEIRNPSFNIIPELKKSLKCAQDSNLEYVWKRSLGIKFLDNNHDKKIGFEKLQKKMTFEIPRFESFFKNSADILNQHSKSDPMVKSLLALTDIRSQYDESAKKYKIVNPAGREIDTGKLFIQAFIDMRKTLDGKSSETLDLLILTLVIGTQGDIMIETFPHETIGRYPKMFGNECSIDVYKKHASGLEQLYEKVGEKLESIEFMFNP